MEDDWKYWGDVSLDVEGAKIHVLGGMAWLATSGTVSQAFEIEEGCKYVWITFDGSLKRT